MLAATTNRPLVRFALRALCLAGFAASAAPAQAQIDILVESGSTATVPGTFASGTYRYVQVYDPGSTLDVNAPLTATDYVGLSAFSTLNVNANFALDFGVQASVDDGATLSLNSGMFGGAKAQLYLENASFQRSGGSYAFDLFSVTSGSANFATGDSLSSLYLYDGATFTLETSLLLNDSLIMSGSTTTLNRTGGAAISASSLTVQDGAVFTTDPGDYFTGATVVAYATGSIQNTLAQSLGHIMVNGLGAGSTSYTTTAPITVGGGPFANDIVITDGGTFNAYADVTAGSVLVDVGGTYSLVSGTSTATSLVVRSGTLSRVAGNYQVDLAYLSNATMDFQPGDSVDYLELEGSVFATGTSPLAALELQDLTIVVASQLALGNFGGADGQVTGWGLKVAGGYVSQLQFYIDLGWIVSLDSTPLSVLYNATSNATYVTAVPEPSTLALAAAGGLLAGWRTLRRRRVAR